MFEEWQKEMEEAHNCEECQGKIFAMSMNGIGQVICAYCNEPVDYPHAKPEELKEWMKAIKLKEEKRK